MDIMAVNVSLCNDHFRLNILLVGYLHWLPEVLGRKARQNFGNKCFIQCYSCFGNSIKKRGTYKNKLQSPAMMSEDDNQ
jgi:hypothetical protein